MSPPLTPRSLDGTPQVAPRDWRLGQTKFLRIDDGTELLNVNGLPAGSATVVWNGTGAGDTGGDWTQGGTAGQTESAAAMHSGTNGLDTGTRGNNDTTEFVTTPTFDLEAAYDSVSFWLNPQLKETNTSLLIQWYESSGSRGTKLDVASYVSNFDIDVWQKVTIPIADFGLPASQLIDELRFEYGAQGPKNQQYYFDDIELNPTGAGGGPFTFQIAAPDTNTRYHIKGIYLVIAEDNSNWDSGGFTNLTGGLTNGVIVRHRDLDATTIWSITIKDNIDLFGSLRVVNDITFVSGEHMLTFVLEPSPASVVVTDRHVMEIVVSDNLSTINNFRAYLHFGVEVVAS